MKVKNLTASSKATRALIKNTFAQMMSEKKELQKISVSELVRRAGINRGTFYSHYDDIYSVAEEYEKELINKFFMKTPLTDVKNVETFIDSFFGHMKENHENYKMLCNSNDFFFTAKKLSILGSEKMLDMCLKSPNLKNKDYMETEINISIQGLLWEYTKICRDSSNISLDELYSYTKAWLKNFKERRF